jgi:homoserine dehydrogenase
MEEIRIGLLGFGTVGSGVVAGLRTHGALLSTRLGALPVIHRIADLDVESDRGVAVDAAILTRDAASVVADPEIDIVVELIGGTSIAKDLVVQALRNGKPVVTANKALLAKHGEEIFALAHEAGTDICFGASVGGGIPIIRALREGLIANRIESVQGILNGTCNYILTQMEHEGMAFDTALTEAQEKGYAEADPTLDVDGFDTAHKAVILAALSYGLHVSLNDMSIEGIRGVRGADLAFTAELGYRLKLLAVVRRDGDEIDVRVHPTLLPVGHLLASVDGVYNAVLVSGDLTGKTLYRGRGAGRDPTAATVIADIADIVRNRLSGAGCRVPPAAPTGEPVRLRDPGSVVACCYVRVPLGDGTTTVQSCAGTIERRGIAVTSVAELREPGTGAASAVIMTGPGREADLEKAVEDIAVAGTVRLRIEE